MLSSLIALALATAAATPSGNDLSLVCHIEDWSPPPFVSSTDSARARLGDDDRKLVNQFEKSLRDKSRERENGSISVTEFDRFVERSFNDAVRARPELRPILETVSARYSRTIGVDRVFALNNERLLAEHEASKSAKPFVGKYVQLRYLDGLATWQESMRKIVERAQLNAPDPQSGLTPTLSTSDSTIAFVLAPAQQDSTTPRTVATIDRYTGELQLDKTDAGGRLLYSLSGLCDKQALPRF